MTRTEHLEWAKERARRELWRDDLDEGQAIANALASITSDLNKHDQTRDHPGCQLMFLSIITGNMQHREAADRVIGGFP